MKLVNEKINQTKNNNKVIDITKTSPNKLVICKKILFLYSVAITITDVIAAGPANIGMANGKTDILFLP